MIKVSTVLGSSEWTRTFVSRASYNEYMSYLASLEKHLPSKLRASVGPYNQTCAMEVQLIGLPDARDFQTILEGGHFAVTILEVSPDEPTTNPLPAGIAGTADAASSFDGGTVQSRSSVPDPSGLGGDRNAPAEEPPSVSYSGGRKAKAGNQGSP